MYNNFHSCTIVPFMIMPPSFPDQIEKLLQSNIIMPLKHIRHELGGRGRSSLFRDLAKVDVISSYTHAGQYHALKSSAKFNSNGLWFVQDAGFSKYGTLKNTLTEIITHAETGMTHKELKNLLQLKVQNTLTNLVKLNRVTRELLPDRIYVYLSAEKYKAEDQLQRRLAIQERGVSTVNLPSESVRIELLLEIIRTPEDRLDERKLGIRLRAQGTVISDAGISYVLAYYDIQKKQTTKS